MESEFLPLEWVKMPPGSQFGAAWPHGSCNASVQGSACGYPRRADGSCYYGHPAPPEWVDPDNNSEVKS